MADAVGRRLLISGHVQGVYFRDGVRREALVAGVSGSARNLADGRLEVLLEGDPAAVERVVEWCRTGPPRAEVDDIEITFEPAINRSGFTIG
jgi:acylphosphatase